MQHPQVLKMRVHAPLQVADAGGSMTIHMFGAYFGLSLSMCLSRGTKRKASRDEV